MAAQVAEPVLPRSAPSRLRLRIPRENAHVAKRSLEITGASLFKSGNESELDVQQAQGPVPGHPGHRARAGDRAAPGAERA